MRKRIGIDLDEVLNDLMSQMVIAVNSRFGTEITIEDFNRWDIRECKVLTEAQVDFIERMFEDEDFLETLSPVAGAAHSINLLKQKGHEIFIITAKPPTAIPATSRWLKRYFPMIPAENHIYTHRKDLVDVDILIDDNSQTLRMRNNKDDVLIKRPWNSWFDAENAAIDFNWAAAIIETE